METQIGIRIHIFGTPDARKVSVAEGTTLRSVLDTLKTVGFPTPADWQVSINALELPLETELRDGDVIAVVHINQPKGGLYNLSED